LGQANDTLSAAIGVGRRMAIAFATPGNTNRDRKNLSLQGLRKQMIFRAVTHMGTYVSLRNWIATLLRVTNTAEGRLRRPISAQTRPLLAA
jgi:hypothetical protein